MANTNTRAVQFREADLAQGARLPTGQVAVERSMGQDRAAEAQAYDHFGDRVGKFADQAMAVEAQRQGNIDAGLGAYKPTGGSTIRDANYDAAGGAAYLSNLAARFERDSADVYEKHKADPAAFKAEFAKLSDGYKRDHVFPEYASAFDTRALKLETHYAGAALTAFQQKEKDQRLAGLAGNLRDTETSRTRLLLANPNAPEVDRLVNEQVAASELAIRTMQKDGQISAVKADELIAASRNEAQASVLAARAAKLGSAEDVETFRANLKKQFTDGKVKMDGGAFEQLDKQLGTIGTAKRIEGDRATDQLKRSLDDYLDRQGKGLAPSVAELTARTVEAEKLGPRGVQLVEEARQKLAIRRQIDALPVDQADAFVRGLKRNVSAGAGASLRPYVAPGLDPAAVDRLDGAVATPLQQLLQAMPEGLREQVKINSGHRSREKQEALYAARASNPFGVAAPGTSQHETGMAADLKFASPEAKQWVHENAARFGMHFPGSDIHIEPIERKPQGQGGLSPRAAAVIDDAESYVKARRGLVEKDPLGAAERDGTVPAVAPIDWRAPDAMKAQLGARIDQAEAVARANGRAPVYIRPDEREALKAEVQKGGDGALKLVTSIVEGAGPKARAVLDEIEGATPRLAAIGRMVAHGAPEQQNAARDAFEALRLEQEPGAKVAKDPKDADAIERRLLGAAYGTQTVERQRAIDAARLIYKGRMARGNIDPDSAAGEKTYEQALRLATGQSGTEASAAGGVADYKPPANWSGTRKVLVPESVKADRFPDVIGAITEADLAGAPGGPPERDGKPYLPRDLKVAYPVRVPGGYAFAMGEPGTDDPKWIQGKDGRPFVLNWDYIEPRVKTRVPTAFAR
jgi:hypothetical protein